LCSCKAYSKTHLEKKFQKSKNRVRSYDIAQNLFVPHRDKRSFRD
jgi:hypothetical protein